MTKNCKNCGGIFKTYKPRQLFCSWYCFVAWCHTTGQVTLKCSTCDKVFRRRKSLHERSRKATAYRTKLVYCSRKCYGEHLGKTHGKGAANCINCGYIGGISEIGSTCPKCQLESLGLIYKGQSLKVITIPPPLTSGGFFFGVDNHRHNGL